MVVIGENMYTMSEDPEEGVRKQATTDLEGIPVKYDDLPEAVRKAIADLVFKGLTP